MSVEKKRFSLRRARAGDSSSLAALCGQLGYPSSGAQVLRRLKGIGRNRNSAIFVAASPDKKVAGWIQVAVRQILVADRRAEIEGLVVEQRHRGCGIGSMLLAEAEKWARWKSCSIVTLRSNVVRKEARPFYEARGYKVVKTQWAFIKNLER